MRRFFTRFFATIGFIVVLIVCVSLGLWGWSLLRGPRIATGTVLTLDLTQDLPDAPAGQGLSQLLFPSAISLSDALGALERAGDDPRVKGLIAHIGDSAMGIAQVQELRDAVIAFRAKGKRAVAYADTFGELSSGMRSYYLASAFDEIWLEPIGQVGLVGVRAEMPYFRGTLDLLGILPDFEHREEYKDAANMATEKTMPPAEREELHALIQSIYGQVVAGVAAARKLNEAAVRSLVDRAPLLANEALETHLIDHVGDREDAMAAIGATTENSLPLTRYLDRVGPPHRAGPTIALIYANGLMVRGGDSQNPLTGSTTLGSDALSHAFELAREDKSVRAILFRIDSPGGSAVAAETIWAAVRRARAAGKPVIVSMGDVAGSGGYYIAAPADKIVAEPGTLTGSIGVVAGKFVFGELVKKFGGNWDAVAIGANSGLFSLLQDFTPQERVRLDAVLDDIYATFKQRVGDGRKLDAAAVEAVAKGRVWSGEDAKAHGLVDALGGFATALALAKDAAGIPAGQDVELKPYPAPKTGFDLIAQRLFGNGGGDEDESILPARLRDLLRLGTRELAPLLAPPGALVMPTYVIR